MLDERRPGHVLDDKAGRNFQRTIRRVGCGLRFRRNAHNGAQESMSAGSKSQRIGDIRLSLQSMRRAYRPSQ